MKLPIYYTIDVVSRCNLKCLYCPQGKESHDQPKKFMPFDAFRELTRDILQHARSISLSNWSEPFLHPEITGIIGYIKSNNPDIHLSLSSNGNVQTVNEQVIDAVIDAGLDRLEISISGLDQETYEKYHKKGSLQKAVDTLKLITRQKVRKNSRTPYVCVNYICFPYNVDRFGGIRDWLESEFQESALLDAVDEVRPVRGTIFAGLKFQKNIMKEYAQLWDGRLHKLSFRPRCHFVFKHLVIRADGMVFPCCVVDYDDKHSIGDLNSSSLETIWEQGKKFREGFVQGKNTLCNECVYIHGMFPNSNMTSFKLNLKLMYQMGLHYGYEFDRRVLNETVFRKLWIRHLGG
ncbi:radical SAM protein [candidate division KSB1 bacterium]